MKPEEAYLLGYKEAMEDIIFLKNGCKNAEEYGNKLQGFTTAYLKIRNISFVAEEAIENYKKTGE